MPAEGTLTRVEGRSRKTDGSSLSGASSEASTLAWELSLPGYPTLEIHDDHWDNGERNLVVHKPPVMPQMPLALAGLYGRLRSGVSPTEGRRELRIMLYPTYVDERHRPRVKKSLTTRALTDLMAPCVLRELTAREGVTLEAAHPKPNLPRVDLDNPQDEKPLQHALFFPAEDLETPVLAFVHFRVLPVIHHLGWPVPAAG
ncbi:hypothetical protein FOE67_05850 [Streptomyces calidiresistens]|uniref:Uncharacterized protein n=1 Tax=Streptomyces calidiresistens TaxID=1485586 RepID=A0A7W3T197_9ACTN|nr:hypothetical protein [Streptomyces calidiresistens]